MNTYNVFLDDFSNCTIIARTGEEAMQLAEARFPGKLAIDFEKISEREA